MYTFYKELKHRWLAAAILIATVLSGAASWSLAAPQPASSIPDLAAWAAQRVPGDTEVLITADAGKSPQGAFNTAEIREIMGRLERLLSLVDLEDFIPDDITAKDLEWLADQAVILGRWPRENEPLTGALILRTKDEALAKAFLENELPDVPHALQDGMVYIASSDELLKSIRGQASSALSESPQFKTARQRSEYGQAAFIYADLQYMAPKAVELLAAAVNDDNPEQTATANFSDLQTLASSLRCLIGGENYSEGFGKSELYLLADPAKSGELGHIAFNPSYNIEHPALAQHPGQAQLCYAVNLQYDYNFLYALLGAHPIGKALRSYPNAILQAYDLNMEKDVLGELLTGSLVGSIDKFNYSYLHFQAKPSPESAIPDEKQKPAVKGDRLGLFLDALANSDWRISLDLRDRQKLTSMAKRLDILQQLSDGKLASGTQGQQPDAGGLRWGSLPLAKLIGNTVWIAGKPEACGPAADQEAKWGQRACWKTLQAMNGSKAAAMWMRNNEALVEYLKSQNQQTGQQDIAAIADLLRSRSRVQCGSMVILPDGLRFCEVSEEKR
ncbi:MAG: hypothetical protein Q4F00_01895 [bacterium]|nr:hypothetical protein [bacterium]